MPTPDPITLDLTQHDAELIVAGLRTAAVNLDWARVEKARAFELAHRIERDAAAQRRETAEVVVAGLDGLAPVSARSHVVLSRDDDELARGGVPAPLPAFSRRGRGA